MILVNNKRYINILIYIMISIYALIVGLLISYSYLISIFLALMPVVLVLILRMNTFKGYLFNLWIILLPFTSVLSVGISSKKLSLIDFVTILLGTIIFFIIMYKKEKISDEKIKAILISFLFILFYSGSLAYLQFSKYSRMIIADWNEGNSVLIRALISDIRIICPLFTVLFLSYFIKEMNDLSKVMRFYATGILVACSYGIYEYFIRVTGLGQNFLLPGHSNNIIYGYGTFRISGPFGEPGYYAGFLVISLILSLMIKKNKIVSSRFINLLIVLELINLILTLSTIGWLSFLVAIIYLFLKKKNVKSYLLIFGILMVSILIVITNDVAYQVINKPFAGHQENGFESQAERSNAAVAAIKIFIDHPILGIGNGMFGLLYESYKPSQIIIRPGQPIVNNVYLDIISAYGLIGSIPFLLIFSILVKKLTIVKKMDKENNFFPFLFSGSISVLIIYFAYPTINYNYHWFFYGLILVIPNLLIIKRGDGK